jgi:quercetin dioxygenase-like cupin family protein
MATGGVTLGRDAERVEIARVEGRPLAAPAQVRVLAETPRILMVEVTMPAGQGSPPHVHDHESVGYVVRGQVRAVIGGTTYDLGPGDAFRHPPGVEHELTATGDADAAWLEIKSPPRRTW